MIKDGSWDKTFDRKTSLFVSAIFYEKSEKDYNFKVWERQRIEPLEKFKKVIKWKDLLRFQDERRQRNINYQFSLSGYCPPRAESAHYILVRCAPVLAVLAVMHAFCLRPDYRYLVCRIATYLSVFYNPIAICSKLSVYCYFVRNCFCVGCFCCN